MEKKHPRRRRIILIVVIVIVVCILIAVWRNRALIQMVVKGATTDPAELSQQQEQIDQRLVEELGFDVFAEIDLEASELPEGVEPVQEPSQESTEPETTTPETTTPETTTPTDPGETTTVTPAPSGTDSGISPKEEIIRRYTQKLYAVGNGFKGQVDAIANQARAEFHALPKEEQTSANRRAIVNAKVGELSQLEKSCDAQVNSLLSQMEAELRAIGEDTSSAQALRSYYEDAKANQKAAYIAALR